MIEVSRFRLKDGQNNDEFLAVNDAYQLQFAYQQPGLLRRTVASGLEGEWVAVTLWRSMKDAKRALVESAKSQIVAQYEACMDSSTGTVEYFRELPG